MTQTASTAVHEVGHALGLMHEHSRIGDQSDKANDAHNCRSKKNINNDIVENGKGSNHYVGDYDATSAMSYCGGDQLSDGDLNGLNFLYPSVKPTIRPGKALYSSLYVRSYDGTIWGAARLAGRVSRDDVFRGWSWNGSTASYVVKTAAGKNELIIRPFDGFTWGDPTTQMVVASEDTFRGWSLVNSTASYLATDAAGRTHLYIRPFNGTVFSALTNDIIMSDKDNFRGWSWDGKTASYLAVAAGGKTSIIVRPFDGTTFGTPSRIEAVSDSDRWRGWSLFDGQASYIAHGL